VGVLSVALAFGVAFGALYARRAPDVWRVPAALRRAVRPARSAAMALHRVHSGHIGDYVAWLLFGLAALTALLGLPLL
jgi:multicomponent Na+:H+ antiporter subunit D